MGYFRKPDAFHYLLIAKEVEVAGIIWCHFIKPASKVKTRRLVSLVVDQVAGSINLPDFTVLPEYPLYGHVNGWIAFVF